MTTWVAYRSYINGSLNRVVHLTASHPRCFTLPKLSRRSWGRKRSGGEKKRRGKKSGKALASPAHARNYSAATSARWESRGQEDWCSRTVVHGWSDVVTLTTEKCHSGAKQAKRRLTEARKNTYLVNWKGNLIFDKLEVLWNINSFNMIHLQYLIPLQDPTMMYLVYCFCLNPFLF